MSKPTFTMIAVYQQGFSVSYDYDDMNNAIEVGKMLAEDDDVTYVQVSGAVFGPVMWSRYHQPKFQKLVYENEGRN